MEGTLQKRLFWSAMGAQSSGSLLLSTNATMSEVLTLGQALWGHWGCRQKSAVVPGLSASVWVETEHVQAGMKQRNSCFDGGRVQGAGGQLMCIHDQQQTTENREEGIPVHLCLEAQGEIEVAYGCTGVMWRTDRGWEGGQQAQEDGQGSESEGASFTSSSAWGPGLSL